MTAFPKYDRYKESGVEWLGEIPAGWKMKRSKRVFAQRKERARPDDQQLSATQAYGVIPQAEYEKREGRNIVKISLHLDKRKHVELDDFVISMRSFQGGLERAWSSGAIRSSYTILQPLVEIAPSFFTYFFKTHQYIRALQSTGNFIRDGQDLNYDNFIAVDLPLPPLDEQARIGTFLDRKTAEIDALIAKKQRQIELLDEQKAILINRAVTRGLNPKAKLKPSGIEWIGEIPKGWEVKKIKYTSQIFRGKFTHRPRNDPSLYDGEYPFVQTGDVARAGVEISDYSQTLNEKGLRVSTLVPKGTVAITIAANIGDVAILGFDACFPDSVVGFLPDDGMEKMFLFYVLKGMKEHFLSLAPKNTQHNLNVERVGGESITIPPTEEQRLIVGYIQDLDKKTRELSAAVEQEIDSLKSLRSTLIAHAVTGRIKV